MEDVISLVSNHIKLAKRMIVKYKYLFYDLDPTDIESSVYFALFKASLKYNPEKGKFSTYAYRCIEIEIYRLARLRPPKHMFINLEQPVKKQKGEELKVIDTIDVNENVVAIEDKLFLNDCLKYMNDDERYLFVSYYIEDKTYEDLAKEFKCSYQNIQHKLYKLRNKLRKFADH